MSFTCLACKVRQDFVQQVQVDELARRNPPRRFFASVTLWGFLGKKRLMTCFTNVNRAGRVPEK
jgi:hypothetical protein